MCKDFYIRSTAAFSVEEEVSLSVGDSVGEDTFRV